MNQQLNERKRKSYEHEHTFHRVLGIINRSLTASVPRSAVFLFSDLELLVRLLGANNIIPKNWVEQFEQRKANDRGQVMEEQALFTELRQVAPEYGDTLVELEKDRRRVLHFIYRNLGVYRVNFFVNLYGDFTLCHTHPFLPKDNIIIGPRFEQRGGKLHRKSSLLPWNQRLEEEQGIVQRLRKRSDLTALRAFHWLNNPDKTSLLSSWEHQQGGCLFISEGFYYLHAFERGIRFGYPPKRFSPVPSLKVAKDLGLVRRGLPTKRLDTILHWLEASYYSERWRQFGEEVPSFVDEGVRDRMDLIPKLHQHHFIARAAKGGIRPPTGEGLLVSNDLKNGASLLSTIRNAQDPFSRYLKQRFSVKTQDILNNYYESDPLDDSIFQSFVDEINQIMKVENFFKQEWIEGLSLSRQIRKFLAKPPQGKERIRLNRLILEEVYPKEIELNGTSLIKQLATFIEQWALVSVEEREEERQEVEETVDDFGRRLRPVIDIDVFTARDFNALVFPLEVKHRYLTLTGIVFISTTVDFLEGWKKHKTKIDELRAIFGLLGNWNLQVALVAELLRAERLRHVAETARLVSIVSGIDRKEDLNDRLLRVRETAAQSLRNLEATLAEIEIRERIARLRRNIEQGHQLNERFINDLITYAKLSLGPEDSSMRHLRLLVDQAWFEHVKKFLAGGGAQLPVFENCIPEEMEVTVEEDSFLHMLDNLLTNAAEAVSRSKDLPEPRRRVRVEADPQSIWVAGKFSKEVVVHIIDFGPELDGDAMDPTKWFEPGFSYGKDQNRNMGFGLASAWKTVARHGGRIWAERENRRGETIVSFTLPMEV